jgi:hypothetical protein
MTEKEYSLFWLDQWTTVTIDKYTMVMRCSSYLPIVPDLIVQLYGDHPISEYVKEGAKVQKFGRVEDFPKEWL